VDRRSCSDLGKFFNTITIQTSNNTLSQIRVYNKGFISLMDDELGIATVRYSEIGKNATLFVTSQGLN
jgi:hypothetical protein